MPRAVTNLWFDGGGARLVVFEVSMPVRLSLLNQLR
jgi:hypothetical protein